jgi:putative addiction module killer protein
MGELRSRILKNYVTPSGRAPFREWVEALRDKKGQAIIQAKLEQLVDGLFGDCRPIGSGLSELRIRFGPGYRVYFGQDGENIILLLCGGDKSSQVTDIRLAHRLWKEYQRRMAKENHDA